MVMATFMRRGSGWQARVRRKPHGSITRTFRLKIDAERWAAETEGELLAGGVQPVPRDARHFTMVELFDWYRNTVLSARPIESTDHYRLTTLEKYFGDTPMLTVDPFAIVDYAKHRVKSGKAGGTVRRELGLLSDVFNSAIAFQRIRLPVNPATAAFVIIRKLRAVPPSNKRHRRLRAGELDKLLSLPHSKPTQIREVIRFALAAPMREGEIATMTRDRIDWDRHVYRIARTKTDHITGEHGREMPLSGEAMRILRSLPARIDGRVWDFGEGHSISKAFTRLVKEAGIEDLHFHDLRHEGASRLADMGLNPLQIMAFTGHKDYRSVKHYTHPDAEKLAAQMA